MPYRRPGPPSADLPASKSVARRLDPRVQVLEGVDRHAGLAVQGLGQGLGLDAASLTRSSRRRPGSRSKISTPAELAESEIQRGRLGVVWNLMIWVPAFAGMSGFLGSASA
jgi:hypothetical protein